MEIVDKKISDDCQNEYRYTVSRRVERVDRFLRCQNNCNVQKLANFYRQPGILIVFIVYRDLKYVWFCLSNYKK